MVKIKLGDKVFETSPHSKFSRYPINEKRSYVEFSITTPKVMEVENALFELNKKDNPTIIIGDYIYTVTDKIHYYDVLLPLDAVTEDDVAWFEVFINFTGVKGVLV